ncbi:MAG TPA: tyrosine-protein phosphatase [Anaeromyxobacteraceae bacterium]|nr:tyrosine-protein phosphatase [Anaeromyxobacteraceae bacterium]
MSTFRIVAVVVLLAGASPSLVRADGWGSFGHLASVQAKLDTAGDYVLTWAPDHRAFIEVTAGTSPDSISPKNVVMSSAGGTAVVVTGLDQSKRWYFRVSPRHDRGTVVAERQIPLTGAVNFRDLGGYPTEDGRSTKWGVFYRSDALSKITVSDVAYLESMGLKLDIDLRSDSEVASAPDAITGSSIVYKRDVIVGLTANIVALFADPSVKYDVAGMVTLYDQIIDDNAAVYASVIRDLANNGPGAVLHCSAGKDRAGIASALVLATVGVPDDVIVNDYALTEQYEAVLISQEVPAVQGLLKSLGIDPSRLGFLLGSPPAVMVETLSHIRAKYGSVEKYLMSGGLDAGTIVKLRAEFVD